MVKRANIQSPHQNKNWPKPIALSLKRRNTLDKAKKRKSESRIWIGNKKKLII